ncbi:OLC1v1033147C1 [Oldenlandia corymbosa var. corymbosa]|uniref:OLC1v1033147C1 n=1 Tax=Oldenlandia corymbosa var. corymbosa TaxID=529605 RepID=A0AAV1CQM1_OLDCO|nr:OLC1v1033147C1 [Oldenlandia corymbosa var. corymbosa]
MNPASSSNSRGVNHFYPVQNPQGLNHPAAMNQLNNVNNGLGMPQNFPFHSMGPHFVNQNPYLGFPNQIDANQLFQLQMFNLNNQVLPGNLNIPQNVAFTADKQPPNIIIPQNVPFCGNIQPVNLSLPQSVGFHMNPLPANFNIPQNASFAGNGQMGFVDPRGIAHAQNRGSMIASNGTPVNAQQMLGSSSLGQGIGPAPPSQNQTNFHAQPAKFQGSQRNAMGKNAKNNGKPAHNKNHKSISKHDASGSRTMKPRFQKMHNSKGNFRSPNVQTRKGNGNGGARQSSVVNSAIPDQVEEKRIVTLNYTDKEIEQWREERRKHYPSKANIEKKLMEKMTKPEVFDKVAQLRRQQLKEVLAKQAELGCEVAEIPSYYLSNPDQPVHEKKSGGKAFSKKENFQNRFKKRGIVDKKPSFPNKKDFSNHHASDGNDSDDSGPKMKRPKNDNAQHPTRKSEPTLLQKLLSADIKRDQHHLLQACRFMVLNSFFKGWPEKELKFPQVIIKETEIPNGLDLEECSSEKYSPVLGKIEQPVGNNDDYDNNSSLVQEIGSGEPQDEEGEIID